MKNSHSTTAPTESLFPEFMDFFGDAIKKINAKQRIVSIEYEMTIDKIIVILGITLEPTGFVESKTEIEIIEHDDFHAFLDRENRLIETTGEVDDPREWPIDYATFIKELVSRSDIKDYLIDENLISDRYEWCC
jgi:hypothetical protein